jgi:outer membrane autotransporter protein
MQILATAQRSVQSATDRMDCWRLEEPEQSGIWVTPFAANTTGSGLSSHLAGLTVGVDKQMTSRPILLGAAVSYVDAYSALTSPDAYGQGSQYAVDLYGIGYMGQAYLSASGMVGAGVTHFLRSLDAIDIAMVGSAPIHSTTIGGRIEAGYAIGFGGASARIVPFMAVEPMSVREGSAPEAFTLPQHADTAPSTEDQGVVFHGRTITALPVSAGVQFDNRWQMDGNVAFAPQLRVAWVHDTSPDRDVDRSFAELPSLLISRTTVPTETDAAQVQLSGLWSAGQQWSLKASVDTQLSGAYSTTGGSLSGIWHGGARWAVTAALNAQMSTQFASTGGTMSVRYAW